MNANVKDKGPVAKMLDDVATDAELEKLLAKRHDEIEALLEEARKAKAEGRAAPRRLSHSMNFFAGRGRLE